MVSVGLRRPGSVELLNDLFAARRLSNARLGISLTLSYLTHVFIILAIIFAARSGARVRPGSWATGPVISVTPMFEPGDAGAAPEVTEPAPPEPARPKPKPGENKYVWRAPPLTPRPNVIREVSEPKPLPTMATPPPDSDPNVGREGADGQAEDSSGEDDRPSGLPTDRKDATPQGRLSGGIAGLGRGGTGGGGLIDAWYVVRVRDIIYGNWMSPFRQTGSAKGELSVVVYFRIRRDGAILSPQVERTSGMTEFDRAALRAVHNSRLPPLPPSYPGSTLGVHYSFELEPGQ